MSYINSFGVKMRKLKKINVLDKKIKKLQDCIHNNRYRHPELADCELRAELDGKMAKPLQTSILDLLNASNQAVSVSQTHPSFVLDLLVISLAIFFIFLL